MIHRQFVRRTKIFDFVFAQCFLSHGVMPGFFRHLSHFLFVFIIIVL